MLLAAGLLAAACSHKARAPAAPGAPSDESAAAVSTIEGLQPIPGETVVALDADGDGTPDFWRYSVLVAEGQERVVRKERDLNRDQRIDTWEALDDEGRIATVVFDMDFDGKADLVVTYEKGQLVKKEYAPGFDGMARTAAYYENGKLVRKERDQKGTGKIDTWEYFENDQLDRIGTDLDGDGQVDRWEKRGEADGSSAPATAAPPAGP
ncbi:MAG TPA: hypothetical protein VEA99_08300 [Gemmatimonadaceae bacterium]|nr:hypothetical protein [Gemmatimonadaceae bacterium]